MPQIFISHAEADRDEAEALYDRLSRAGFRAWMASRDIPPGEAVQSGIEKALDHSDLVLVLLSDDALEDESFWTVEFPVAFNVWQRRQEEGMRLIPVRLEEVEVPKALLPIQGVDLFREDGAERLVQAINRLLTPGLEPPGPPDDLVDACLKGDAVAYVGAGLSAPAGLPTWRAFAQDLLDWAEAGSFIDPNLGQTFRRAAQIGVVDSVVDGVVSAVQMADPKGGLLEDYLRKVFLGPSAAPTPAYRALGRAGFSAALTTNFDTLLEQTFFAGRSPRVYTPADAEAAGEAMAKRDFFLMKLYGSLERPETVVVAPAQYSDIVAGNRPFGQFMRNLFVSRTILFLGASLDGIVTNLDSLQLSRSARQHYALVAVTGSEWQVLANRLERRYNVRVLPYALSESHPEVLDFLEELAGRVAERTSKGVTRGVSKGQKERRLARVQLENIGPFAHLELELNPGWNILLGDNGVGKSNILRAIALAISGQDAAAYADRLIRYGQTSGRIVLQTTEGGEHITDLYRTGTAAEMKITSAWTLAAEQELALGFPPFRGVSWRRPEGPERQKGRPYTTPVDLLPLVTGEPDPRMDDLKQWIVNLDYRAGKGSQAGGRKILEDFFAVVGHMTEGISLRFGGVDPHTYQITVLTDDGEVPLEAVSQGTQSLLGWIGLLLQRLYDVYGEEGEPRQRYALVLIDEVGAHMHPAWQRTVVGKLRELFPNVQFVATTHSPLIPIGSAPEEVFRLRRDETDRSRILVDQPNLDLRRWRADQVLTSPLFDLDSTIKPETYQAVQRYTELAAREDLSKKEKREMARLAAELEIRPPAPQEREMARQAFEKIEKALDEQLKEMPLEKQKKLLEEARVQLQENVTGSRRPS